MASQRCHLHSIRWRPIHIVLFLITCTLIAAREKPSLNQENADSTRQSSSPSPGSPPPRSVPSSRQAEHIAVLTVKGVIDGVTLRSLERRIRTATTNGATAIVFDIDTPGGELTAALDICNLFKDQTITPANTVAWVHPQAYSAGTIISLACREIVVAPNATFGDAAPIKVMPGAGLVQLQPAERAKTEAPLLAEVIDSARRNHYDEKLVQAFVSVGIELWLIEHTQSGERIVVNRSEYGTVFGEEPPDQITPVAPPKPVESTPPVRPWISELFQVPGETEQKPPSEEEITQQIEFDQLLPPLRQPLSKADRGQWRLVTQVITSDRLLTVKPAEAIHYGLATKVIANDQELLAFFGALTLTRYDRSWSEVLVRFLISLPVRAVLIVIFIVALFIELAAPGVGVFGTTAIISLSLLIGAPYLAGMAQWWDILLILLGILLVMVELFLIPGFGLAGVAGVVCLLAGMVGTFVSGDLQSTEGTDQMWSGLITTIISLFTAGIVIWFVSQRFHSIPILNQVVLTANLADRNNQTMSPGGGLLEAMGAASQRALEPGDLGLAETDLRPAGKGKFHDRIIDVKSIGEFIERGKPICVVSVGRFVIEVEETKA